MALWGKTDELASEPKWVARKAFFDSTAVDTVAETINILSSNTGFSTGDELLYTVDGTVIDGLTDDTTYYARVVGAGVIELYDTYAHAVDLENTTGRLNIAGPGVGTHVLQRTGAANTFGDHTYNGNRVIFIDGNEAEVAENKAKGFTNAGWYLYRTYTDAQENTRHKTECLVAIRVMAEDAGDAADDEVAPDLYFMIDMQPQPTTGWEGGNPDTATFSVEMDTNAAPDTITYQWQKSDDDGDTWYNIVGATASTYTTGSLLVAEDNGDLYRVIVKCADQTIVSNEVLLTVQLD